ncbi:MAG: YtxH domain-containing protein [Gemmatimonadaceae bacterium]|nr:YtxH domain-containing protein [Gemmatimonadaceae bacterium]
MIYEEDEVTEDTGAEMQETAHDEGASTSTVALAVLAGAAIGAAVALMLAPKSGQEVRRVIRKRAQGLRETAGNLIDDTSEDLSRELRRRGRQIRRRLDRMA